MNAALLRIAREAHGYTQTRLAELSGLPQTDISRWESGLRTPGDEQIQRLAETLELPRSLLISDVRPSQPVHRTARVQSKKAERQVDGRLELARIGASNLMRDIDLDAPFSFPTPGDAAPGDPEAAADALRRVWRMPDGPVDSLTSYLEAAGAIVVRVDFGTDDILAAYNHPRGDHRWFFLNTRAHDGARARFSLAHELGHAILHWDRFEAPTDKDAEREAHAFAAALLMPRRPMLTAFGGKRVQLQDLRALRTRWGVSMQALITRASELGLITATHKTRLWKQLSARGWRKAEPGFVPLEESSVFAGALEIHRTDHQYGDAELAQIAQLPQARLSDLLPDYFAPPAPRVKLAVVR